MADQEIAARPYRVELGRLRALDAPCHESDDGVAEQGEESPDGDLVAQACKAADCSHGEHEQRYGDCADHHGAGMQLQQLAIEVEAAGLL